MKYRQVCLAGPGRGRLRGRESRIRRAEVIHANRQHSPSRHVEELLQALRPPRVAVPAQHRLHYPISVASTSPWHVNAVVPLGVVTYSPQIPDGAMYSSCPIWNAMSLPVSEFHANAGEIVAAV